MGALPLLICKIRTSHFVVVVSCGVVGFVLRTLGGVNEGCCNSNDKLARARPLAMSSARAELIGQAAARGARVAVLPEFFNTEYFAQYRDEQYFALAEPLDGPSISAIKEVARYQDIWVIASVYERFRSGIYFDSSVVISPGGEITEFIAKRILPQCLVLKSCTSDMVQSFRFFKSTIGR